MPVPLPFREGDSRYSLFPLRDPTAWKFYKQAQAATWTAEEVDLASDDFDTLTDGEKRFVKHILGFFAFGDGLVNENIVYHMLRSVEQTELRYFYSFQLAIENVHAETYSLLIDKYIRDAGERERVNHAITHMACMQQKAAWITRWISDGVPFAERLVAFACVEGIFFSGAFCAIFWLKKQSSRIKLPGLFFSNELISRDEALHCEFACYLHSRLHDPAAIEFDDPLTAWDSRQASPERVQEIISSAVEMECKFVDEALPLNLIGMNADLMKEYIRFVADRLCTSLGANRLFGTANPFDFMEMISLQGKTNFFEKRVSEYQKAGVMVGGSFKTNDEF